MQQKVRAAHEADRDSERNQLFLSGIGHQGRAEDRTGGQDDAGSQESDGAAKTKVVVLSKPELVPSDDDIVRLKTQ